MSIYHPVVRVNGKTNYDFSLIVAHFEPDNGQTEFYLDLEPIFTDNFDGTQSNDHGAKYTKKAAPVVTFVEVDGSDMHPAKIRHVLRWLTGQRNVSWMDLLNQDGECVCSYLGRFISVQAQKLDSRVVGLVCQFQATSPWAYSAVKEYSINIGNNTFFSLENDTDDLYTYIYPNVTLDNTGTAFTLKNTTSDSETKLSNLSSGEFITIDSNLFVHSSKNRLFNNDFNYVFPELVPGTNSFIANGSGQLTIKFRHPMKVGDGLLDDYDIHNGVVLYIESGVLKIKGDITQNPPVGVHIEVANNKLTVRGTIRGASVHTPTFIDVNNANLTIEDSGKDCPFDALDAKVVNGELIINYDMRHIDIPKNGAGD